MVIGLTLVPTRATLSLCCRSLRPSSYQHHHHRPRCYRPVAGALRHRRDRGSSRRLSVDGQASPETRLRRAGSSRRTRLPPASISAATASPSPDRVPTRAGGRRRPDVTSRSLPEVTSLKAVERCSAAADVNPFSTNIAGLESAWNCYLARRG